MKVVTVTIYEKEDYDKVDEMSYEEVISVLKEISETQIGLSNYSGQDNYEGDPIDYMLYKSQVALAKACKLIDRARMFY